jgi:hypothetical protein
MRETARVAALGSLHDGTLAKKRHYKSTSIWPYARLQGTCEGEDAEAQDGHRPYDGDNQVDPSVARPPRHLPLVGLGVAVEQLHNRGDQGDVQNGGGQLGGGPQDLQGAYSEDVLRTLLVGRTW